MAHRFSHIVERKFAVARLPSDVRRREAIEWAALDLDRTTRAA